jgi:hypothetical protein
MPGWNYDITTATTVISNRVELQLALLSMLVRIFLLVQINPITLTHGVNSQGNYPC